MQFQFTASPLDYCVEKRFDIYRCLTCGHGVTGDVLETDLESVYEGGAYDKNEKIWHKLLRPILNFRETGKVGYLNKYTKSERLVLEIGAGKGYFLRAALKAGFDAYGIEPSTRSYNVASRILGDRVYKCTLEEMHVHPALNRKYDFIFLWHVLEHLQDPGQAVALMRRFLKPEGFMIIGVPNFDSYQSKVGKSNWYHLDPPRHLSHFTPRSIKSLMNGVQMNVEEIMHDSFFQNYLGEMVTLNNRILPHKNIFLNVLRFNNFYLKRVTRPGTALNFFAFIVISTVSFIPALVFTAWSQWVGKAGTMVVVASNRFNGD